MPIDLLQFLVNKYDKNTDRNVEGVTDLSFIGNNGRAEPEGEDYGQARRNIRGRNSMVASSAAG
ncbi:MAG: hypothetical protein HGB20_06020 [Chlorobiaceae bacterium]|nr:hypothetical protein [Chlorobiaceae bacterium]